MEQDCYMEETNLEGLSKEELISIIHQLRNKRKRDETDEIETAHKNSRKEKESDETKIQSKEYNKNDKQKKDREFNMNKYSKRHVALKIVYPYLSKIVLIFHDIWVGITLVLLLKQIQKKLLRYIMIVIYIITRATSSKPCSRPNSSLIVNPATIVDAVEQIKE